MADHPVDGMMAGLPAARTSDSAPDLPFERLRRPAARLAVLFLVAAVFLWRLDIDVAWEPRFLNFALQLTLVSSISLAAAILAVRSFLRSGSWPVLWLGARTLSYAITIAFSNSLLQWENVNAAVTAHSLNVLMVASLHLVGAFFVFNGIGPRLSRGRGHAVLEVYIGSVTVVALVTLGAVMSIDSQPGSGTRVRVELPATTAA